MSLRSRSSRKNSFLMPRYQYHAMLPASYLYSTDNAVTMFSNIAIPVSTGQAVLSLAFQCPNTRPRLNGVSTVLKYASVDTDLGLVSGHQKAKDRTAWPVGYSAKYALGSPILHLASSEQRRWSGGKGILTELSLCYSLV